MAEIARRRSVRVGVLLAVISLLIGGVIGFGLKLLGASDLTVAWTGFIVALLFYVLGWLVAYMIDDTGAREINGRVVALNVGAAGIPAVVLIAIWMIMQPSLIIPFLMGIAVGSLPVFLGVASARSR